jgi:anti-sigma-K factor RskA
MVSAAAGTREPSERLARATYNPPVAKVEPTIAAEQEESPPLDPNAVERSYREHRARRRARERWHRERRWASLRFWFVLVLVLTAAVLLAARTLGEIERVFGL